MGRNLVSVRVAIAVLALLAASGTMAVPGDSGKPAFTQPTTLTMFVNETQHMEVAGNLTGGAFQFGTLTVWSSPLITSLDSSGVLVGRIDGFNAFTGANTHLVSAVLSLQTDLWDGTITIFGSTPTSWSSQRNYAITGGSGTFIYAKGEATFNHPYDNSTGFFAICNLYLRFD